MIATSTISTINHARSHHHKHYNMTTSQYRYPTTAQSQTPQPHIFTRHNLTSPRHSAERAALEKITACHRDPHWRVQDRLDILVYRPHTTMSFSQIVGRFRASPKILPRIFVERGLPRLGWELPETVQPLCSSRPWAPRPLQRSLGSTRSFHNASLCSQIAGATQDDLLWLQELLGVCRYDSSDLHPAPRLSWSTSICYYGIWLLCVLETTVFLV